MKKRIIALLVLWLAASQILAADQAELEEILSEIQTVRPEIQKSTASFLLIAKQMKFGETVTPQAEQIVQITDSRIAVLESDLQTAPTLLEALEGDEFLFIEERNDWYKIALEDGREGWVLKENAQLIERVVNAAQSSLAVDPQVRSMTNQLYSNIRDQYERARGLFEEFEEEYDDLSAAEKANAGSINSTYQKEKEKIQTYYAYASHYHKKLQPLQSPVAAQGGRNEISYQGTASLRLGSSSYESSVKESTTSRNLNANGSVIFNPQSRLNININHNNDVVQTPYTSNDINLAFQHQTAEGTRLQGSVLYNSYNDENFERNNFKNVGVGAKVEHPLNAETQIFGDIQANSKSYDVAGGNEFQGARFNTGLNYNGSKTRANIGVRGRVQTSDVSFLEYMRVIPNAGVRWLTGGGSFGIKAEGEQLTYASEAEGNNFNRGRVDLEWAGQTSSTALILIAKQYPNNEAFDNYRLRLQNQWNRNSGAGLARTGFYVQYVYHPQENTQLTNYIDLRLDRNSSSDRSYFDISLSGRYWEETGRDHRVDLFSRFGIKYSQFQVGPVVGAQVLLNPDDLQIEQNGNSFRFGVDARANASIQKATIYGNVRYQKSLVYNSEITIDTSTGLVTEGELQTRMPTTIQFSGGLQVPLIDALDLKIDMSYYNVDLDISDEISINPVQSRTGLRLLAGVSYRFRK